MPDKLGHSDNYIEANSMQTPVSIPIFLFILLIFSSTNHLFLINILDFPSSAREIPVGYNYNYFNSKEDVLKLIDHRTKDNYNYYFNDIKFANNFKYLANGVFQAEGHIGGYFTGIKVLNFRPIVFIGITTNIESLKFLVMLNSQFDMKMKYSIEKLPSHFIFY